MSCEPNESCTCDDDLCLARVAAAAQQDAAAVYDGDTMMIRSADGAVHTVPIETRG